MERQPDDPGQDDTDFYVDDFEAPETKRRLLLAHIGKWHWPRWWATRLQFAKRYED